MNLLPEFDTALTLDEYELELGEHLPLHKLHYRKAINKKPSISLPSLKSIVLTVPPCGDSLAIIPVLQRYFEGSDVEMRIALRDEYPELMNRFLTNGKKAVPVVLVLDEHGELLFRYGPRPAKAQEIFSSMQPLLEAGKIEKVEISRKIRNFYAKDRGKAILDEFEDLLIKVFT